MEAAARRAARVTASGRRSARRGSRAPDMTTAHASRSHDPIWGGRPSGGASHGRSGPVASSAAHSHSATSSNARVVAIPVAGRPR